ncbi:MAG TPA: Hsp20/alpha crystallin family protein [Nocardioidaceae bacterium]|nr:Hsp20/alpha crystallin family protein [Nocardioidaceae bacterium]
MGKLFRDVVGELATDGGSPVEVGLPLDLVETEDAYIAELDLPGIKQDDLEVELIGDEILVRGEVRPREWTGVVRQQGRPTGSVEHRFTVPGRIDPDRIEAELSDGVLTIQLPKADSAKPKRIDVKVR